MVRPRPPPCQSRGSLRLRAAPPRRTHTPRPAPRRWGREERSEEEQRAARRGPPRHGPRRRRAPFSLSACGAEAAAAAPRVAKVRGARRPPPEETPREVSPTRQLSSWHSHCVPFPTAEAPFLKSCLDFCPKLALELAGTRFSQLVSVSPLLALKDLVLPNKAGTRSNLQFHTHHAQHLPAEVLYAHAHRTGLPFFPQPLPHQTSLPAGQVPLCPLLLAPAIALPQPSSPTGCRVP